MITKGDYMESNTNYYNYLVTLDMLIPNEEKVTFTDLYLGDIQIEKDFDNAYFPIFSISVFFTTELFYKMIENKENVKFRFKMEKYIVDEKNTEQRKYKELVLNDIFTTYLTDDSINVYKDILKAANNKNDGNNITASGTVIDLYLFKESDMLASRNNINAIISQGNMTDVLTFLFSKSGVKKMLMAPIDNNEIYTEILLPPSTTIQNVLYLEKMYGLYKNGTTLFFDIDTTYLLPKTASTVAYKSGEYLYTTLACYKSGKSASVMAGSYKDNIRKTYTVYVNVDNISFSTDALVNEQVSGNNLSIVDTSSNSITTVEPDVSNRNSGNVKTVINNFNNKYLQSILENRKVENDNVINATLYDFDIETLTPNKRINVVFEDSSIQRLRGGNYRLTKCRLYFSRQGSDYTISAKVTLKKSL